MKTKKEILSGIENIAASKIIARNTVKITLQDGTILIRLHATNIVTIDPKGKITLNSGGWRTPTTKERINQFSPACIRQDKGIWYLDNGKTFYDGITIDGAGKVTSKDKPVNTTKIDAAKKQITKFCSKITKENLPVPSSGDCWFCSLHTKEGESMGEAFKDHSHLSEHVKEGYLHGSLLVNAMRETGYRDEQIKFHYSYGYADTFKRAVSKYLQKRLIPNIAAR